MPSSVIQSALKASLIRPRLNGETKPELIRAMIDILDDAGLLPNRAEAERVVLEREEVMSTGLESGLAIPHGKTDTVDRLLVAVGLKPEGVDFDCADGQLARILVLTLSPASTSGPHIRFMAEVTRLLSNADARERLLAAQTSEQALSVLREEV